MMTRKLWIAATGVGALALALSLPVNAEIVGEYVEARTCDVWTGPCFSNSEINLKGDHGIMAWSVREGTFEGVRLDGLRVAASIDAEGTLGTPVEGKVRTMVFVDVRANTRQREALVAMVKKLAPRYTRQIVKVQARQIAFVVRGGNVELQVTEPKAKKTKKAEMALKTRPIMSHCDVVCGNEEKAYPSLAKTTSAQCAKSLVHFYRGGGLGAKWSEPGARSAMVGDFKL